MTSWRYGASTRIAGSPPSTVPSPPRAGSIWPAPTWSSTSSTSSGSTETTTPVELREPLGRADDRGPGGGAVETVEAERVREESRDASREAVELRERVLPERDEDVDAKRRAEHERKRLGERCGASVVGVIEEVLLCLVEDEVHVPLRLCVLERRRRGPVRVSAGGLANRFRQRGIRIVAPAREDDDERLLRELAERAGDGGAQKRRLPHPARSVQDREA